MEKIESIIQALRNGTVPLEGTELIAVGIENEINEISEQLEKVKRGKSSFKFIVGDYGSGKTFLGASAREKAFEHNFIVSNIVISQETPLNKFEEVYKKIIEGMRRQDQIKMPALNLILESWLFNLEKDITEIHNLDPIDNEYEFMSKLKEKLKLELSEIGNFSSNFANALYSYYDAKTIGDNTLAQDVLSWIKGEKISLNSKRRMNVAETVRRENAFNFIKAITLMIKKVGYSGLVIVIDELETVLRYKTSLLRTASYDNLRYFVDELDRNGYPNCYFLFTGTTDLIEAEKGIRALEPLYQRIKTKKEEIFINYKQPIIYLSGFNDIKLKEVSKKVISLHSKYYNWNPNDKLNEEFIEKFIEEKTNAFGGKIEVKPRSYLRILIDILDKSEQYTQYKPKEHFKFDEDIYKEILETEEEVSIIEF